MRHEPQHHAPAKYWGSYLTPAYDIYEISARRRDSPPPMTAWCGKVARMELRGIRGRRQVEWIEVAATARPAGRTRIPQSSIRAARLNLTQTRTPIVVASSNAAAHRQAGKPVVWWHSPNPADFLVSVGGTWIVFLEIHTMFEFDWNKKKAASNLAKHKVSFAEGASVFMDMLALTYPDGEHSSGEERFLTFGMSNQHRILVVSHVETACGIRIISARRATREERNIYEENR